MSIFILATKVNGDKVEIRLEGVIFVGRSADCHFVFADDARMSGRHGKFQLRSAGDIIYTDLDSSNGSFLNDKKVTEVKFTTNDSIKLGKTVFKIDDKKLTEVERSQIDGLTKELEVIEVKTCVIVNADLIIRPQFEKNSAEKKTSLTERWNMGTDVDLNSKKDESEEKKIMKKHSQSSFNLELDRKKKK